MILFIAFLLLIHIFYTNFDRLVELAPESVLIIEEAHQYVGCGDAGADAYVTTYGYHSLYEARTV